MSTRRHDRIVHDLRQRIARLEGGAGGGRRASLPFGIARIDNHLPGGGLALGALHELIGGGPDLMHGAATALLAAGTLARVKGPVLWCLPSRDLFAPALAGAGLHPDRLIYAETRDESAVLPVAEEGLRYRGLAGVVAETGRLTLTASRRLQLAAEESGVTAIVIRRWRRAGELPADGTAAVTRWRVSALSSATISAPGVGRPRWRLELLRCRGGEPADWTVEACDATGHLRLAPDVADRSAAPAIGYAAAG